MTYTRQEILEIVAETVEETLKDIQDTAEAIKLIGDVILTVNDALTAAPSLIETPAKTRSLQAGALAHQVMSRLTEAYTTPSDKKGE